MIAKCTECGKEYEIKDGEKPSDYQCECGGELQHQKTQSKKPATKASTTADGHYALFIGILSGIYNFSHTWNIHIPYSFFNLAKYINNFLCR